jgi:hypothetical protein
MLNLLTDPAYGYDSSPDARRQTALCSSKVDQLRPSHGCSVHLRSGDNTGFEVENSDTSSSCVSSLNSKRSSGGESSNVDRWFEQHNAEVQKYSTYFVDSDPPFFTNDVPSPEASSVLQQSELRHDTGVKIHNPLQARTGLLQLRTDAISTEVFRSIVDDLAIEIKTLERKLERHDDIHNQDSGNEKLFELRVYNLEADKRRELEGILHRFVAGLSDRSSVVAADDRGVILPDAKPHGAACSPVSTLDHGSARASVSASVHSFPAPASDGTHVNIPHSDRVKTPNIRFNTKHPNECLQPWEDFTATNTHAKRKCVVYRLEQLFAGRNVLTDPHPPALQQQQQQHTSHETKRAEHSAIVAWDQSTAYSGFHKASVLNKEVEDSVNTTAPEQLQALSHETVGNQMSGRATQRYYAGHLVDSGSKITRLASPLSLDLDHSQLVAENIRYVHHLGFPPNDMGIDKPPGEEYEWIYLNILVNMAQLHTLNVTHDFIRKAISELSNHYIMSKDGSKVRWRSSWSLAKKRRHDDDAPGHHIGGSAVGKHVYKRLKAAHDKDSRASLYTGWQSKHAPSTWKPHQDNSKVTYTPLFYHGPTEDVANHFSGERVTVDMPTIHRVHGESSVADRSHVVTAPKKDGNERGTSRIVFYNNTQFYTDLDGEPFQHQDSETSSRMESTLEPDCKEDYSDRGFELVAENPAPFEDIKADKELIGPTGCIPETVALEIPPLAAPRSSDEMISLREINLEVTGLGGTYPADNFVIDVQTHCTPIDETEVSISAAANLPERFARIFRAGMPQSEVRTTFCKRVLNTRYTELPPSELPPALSFSLFDDESIIDDSSGSDVETSVSLNL